MQAIFTLRRVDGFFFAGGGASAVCSCFRSALTDKPSWAPGIIASHFCERDMSIRLDAVTVKMIDEVRKDFCWWVVVGRTRVGCGGQIYGATPKGSKGRHELNRVSCDD